MKKKKCIRLLSLILIVAMMCTAMSMTVLAEPRESGKELETKPVEYYDENGLVDTKTCTRVLSIDPDDSGEIVLNTGWYVIDSTSYSEILNRIHVVGDVHLIAQNGNTCNLAKGIRVPSGNTLSLYAAVGYTPSGYAGIFVVTPSSVSIEAGCAAIGGDKGEYNGVINIYGGTIQTIVGLNGPCIGKGEGDLPEGGSCGAVTIFYGKISGLQGIGHDAVALDGADIVTKPGMISSSGNYVPCSHTDADSDGKCDDCKAQIECTVTFDMGDGTTVEEIVPFNGTVTEPEEPERAGFTFDHWTYDGEPYDFGSMVRSDRTITASWKEGVVAYAKSATVVFDDQLELRFTLRFSDALLEDEGAYVELTRNNETTKYVISECTAANASGGEYQFIVPVDAPTWTDEVSVSVFDGSDFSVTFLDTQNVPYAQNTLTYSVYDHYKNVVSNPGNYSENYIKFLQNGLYYYCRNAQVYFDYNVDENVGTDATPAITISDDYRMTTSGQKPDGLDHTTLRVNFVSANTLRVTFVLPGKNPDDYTFTAVDCNGNPVEGAQIKPVGNKKYAIDIEGITAANLGKTYSVTIKPANDPDSAGYTVHASVMSYAILLMENPDYTTKAADLGKGLYLYGKCAEEYFPAPAG